MTDKPTTHCYEFDAFRLDARRRVLLRDGAPVALTAKAVDLLLVLIRERGDVLEKDELLRALWPDTVVEEGNLTVNISALRKALGESPQERRYILTVPGRGYRFVAAVREVDDEGGELIIARRTRARVVIEREEAESDADTSSIAVLPFKPLTPGSGDDGGNDYLGLGIADALITRFSQLRQMTVRPTSAVLKYARADCDPLAAGRELGVGSVLDGHVQRAGEHLRVTAQLVRVRDGAVLWGEKFAAEFTHIFALQDSIAEQVTSALMLTLSGEQQRRLVRRDTEDAEAYRLYLKGVYFTNKGTKEGAQKGVAFFRQAIERDANYAQAYAGLADSWCWLSHLFIDPKEALPQARAAALKALELDETLAEAHVSLGLMKMWYEWEWEECARQFRRAIELNPNLAPAHLWHGFHLVAMKQFEAGLAEAELALTLDPLSLNHNTMYGWLLYFARRYDRAAEQFRAAAELEPHYFAARWGLGWTRIQQGRYDEAVTELEQGLALGGGTELTAALSHAHARAGRRDEARRLLDELRELTKQRYVSPFYFALAHVGLGEVDETFAALQQAYRDRFEWLVQVRVDPVWEPLEGDSRFADLLRRVGLKQ
jgi:DNA-binding winged helix-turn-helix (wHTH) protein/tetratricopeptide (TPR) repeat protein